MRSTVITPLFPPDVSLSATYAKELVHHLASETSNVVTCLHYGQLPEAVAGVTFISIKKDVARQKRLLQFIRSLFTLRRSDALLILNGPSVELPTALLLLVLPRRGIFIESDADALEAAGILLTGVSYLLKKRYPVLRPTDTVLHRPLIHPLLPHPTTAVKIYHEAWQQHLKEIYNLCQPN